jgi:hypothetical protein
VCGIGLVLQVRQEHTIMPRAFPRSFFVMHEFRESVWIGQCHVQRLARYGVSKVEADGSKEEAAANLRAAVPRVSQDAAPQPI